jgi:hypothetical protein
VIDLTWKTKKMTSFIKMAEDIELVLACSVIIAATAGVASLLITTNRKRKQSVWVIKYIRNILQTVK